MTAAAESCQVDPDGKSYERLNRNGNPVKSVPHTLAGIRTILRSIPKRVELGEVDLPDLATMAALHQAIDEALTETVRRLRLELDWRGRPAYSWANIGDALGMTRQSAQERFGR